MIDLTGSKTLENQKTLNFSEIATRNSSEMKLDQVVKDQTDRFADLFRQMAMNHKQSITTVHDRSQSSSEDTDAFQVVLRKFLSSDQISSLSGEVPPAELLDLGRNKSPSEVYLDACAQLLISPASPLPLTSGLDTIISAGLSPPSAQLLSCAAALHSLGGTDSITVEGMGYPDSALAQVLRASAGDVRKPKKVVIKDCTFGPLSAGALFEYHSDPSVSRIEELEICNASAALDCERRLPRRMSALGMGAWETSRTV